MPQYIILESGTERILGVARAVDAISACLEVSRRPGCGLAHTLIEIQGAPGLSDWLAYELPEPFEEARAWEMFGPDALHHGRLAAVVALQFGR